VTAAAEAAVVVVDDDAAVVAAAEMPMTTMRTSMKYWIISTRRAQSRIGRNRWTWVCHWQSAKGLRTLRPSRQRLPITFKRLLRSANNCGSLVHSPAQESHAVNVVIGIFV